MDGAKATVLVFLIVTIGGVASIVHYNQIRYNVQRECMDHGGSWETRESSSEIGCRMTGGKK